MPSRSWTITTLGGGSPRKVTWLSKRGLGSHFTAWRTEVADLVRALGGEYVESALRVGHSKVKGYGGQAAA